MALRSIGVSCFALALTLGLWANAYDPIDKFLFTVVFQHFLDYSQSVETNLENWQLVAYVGKVSVHSVLILFGLVVCTVARPRNFGLSVLLFSVVYILLVAFDHIPMHAHSSSSYAATGVFWTFLVYFYWYLTSGYRSNKASQYAL